MVLMAVLPFSLFSQGTDEANIGTVILISF
jgi:hypothetical protein